MKTRVSIQIETEYSDNILVDGAATIRDGHPSQTRCNFNSCFDRICLDNPPFRTGSVVRTELPEGKTATPAAGQCTGYFRFRAGYEFIFTRLNSLLRGAASSPRENRKHWVSNAEESRNTVTFLKAYGWFTAVCGWQWKKRHCRTSTSLTILFLFLDFSCCYLWDCHRRHSLSPSEMAILARPVAILIVTLTKSVSTIPRFGLVVQSERAVWDKADFGSKLVLQRSQVQTRSQMLFTRLDSLLCLWGRERFRHPSHWVGIHKDSPFTWVVGARVRQQFHCRTRMSSNISFFDLS